MNYYPNLFQTENPLLLEKVLWSVTNLAQTPVIRKAMGIKGVSSALIDLFIHAEKKEKRNILQPIINLLLDGSCLIVFDVFCALGLTVRSRRLSPDLFLVEGC